MLWAGARGVSQFPRLGMAARRFTLVFHAWDTHPGTAVDAEACTAPALPQLLFLSPIYPVVQ